jgi:hypothetical protein
MAPKTRYVVTLYFPDGTNLEFVVSDFNFEERSGALTFTVADTGEVNMTTVPYRIRPA